MGVRIAINYKYLQDWIVTILLVVASSCVGGVGMLEVHIET